MEAPLPHLKVGTRCIRGCVEHACMVSCIQPHQLGSCEQCLTSEQCAQGMYCCPFMKKCVPGPGTWMSRSLLWPSKSAFWGPKAESRGGGWSPEVHDAHRLLSTALHGRSAAGSMQVQAQGQQRSLLTYMAETHLHLGSSWLSSIHFILYIGFILAVL